MKYLFGPVNSRRLGISLGIDLVPFKTCSLDCIFCECGKTTNLTQKIAEYIPIDDVIAELDKYLTKKPHLDNITFSGSGEPTLNSGIGKVIEFLKKNHPEYRISLLTNGTLLHIEDIRRSILRADMIMPSLHAISGEIFNRITRPADGITAETHICGLIKLREEYGNDLILELFIIPNINDSNTELDRIKEACLKIMPDKVQLNSLDRPSTEEWVEPPTRKKMLDIKAHLHPIVVEIIGEQEHNLHCGDNRAKDIIDAILSTILRRPSTLQDLSLTLGVKIVELKKIIKYLHDDNKIEEIHSEKGTFYRIKRDAHRPQ